MFHLIRELKKIDTVSRKDGTIDKQGHKQASYCAFGMFIFPAENVHHGFDLSPP
jgi:hypothetical protein